MRNVFFRFNLNKKVNRNKKIEIFYLGNIYGNDFKKMNLNELHKLYDKYGKRIYKFIDGIYSLFVIDYKINKIYVFQDYFGYNQCLYYFKDNKQICFSNELKSIILKNKNVWSINYESAKKFLKEGYICNENTLIEKIYKIPSKKYLEFDMNTHKVTLKRYDYKVNKIPKIITPELYDNIFRKICTSNINNKDNISIALSSGYDTNYILYTLNNSNFKIDAFSVGGSIGRNEVPDAKKIASMYKNVKFYSKLVNEETLNCYPEIVWILEGAVYESGIFLQYELAKMLNQNNKENIVLGECADQVLNYDFYHPLLEKIKKIKFCFPREIKKKFKGLNYKPYKNTYDMASYKIIKKSGIIMNYFYVNPEYPYTRKKFIEISKKVSIKGDKQKKYHKEVINLLLPKAITSILKKIGGATELKTLFVGDISIDNIKEVCKKSKFYKYKKFDDIFYEIDYYMKILYLELFEKIFLENNQKYISKKINDLKLDFFYPELIKGE